ncbi:MAG: hypothetical protein ACYC4A_10980 [Desulfobulbia bacterium]
MLQWLLRHISGLLDWLAVFLVVFLFVFLIQFLINFMKDPENREE